MRTSEGPEDGSLMLLCFDRWLMLLLADDERARVEHCYEPDRAYIPPESQERGSIPGRHCWHMVG